MAINMAARRGLTELEPELRNEEDIEVSATEIDRYLMQLEEPKRTTLQKLREAILRAAPDAEECISYGLPAFRVNGKVIAGFAAFKNHLSYLPHSGSVLDALSDQLAGYTMTKGSLHFPADQPLSDRLVKKLVTVRLKQIRTY
jgi:uncharacterized protein YdhG (YjbR/CyaY superfamily)